MLNSDLADLARGCGVAVEYWDWQGNYVEVAEHTIVAVLEALGHDASSPQAAAHSLAVLRELPWRRLLPPVFVARQGRSQELYLHVRDGVQVQAWVAPELGGQLVELPAVDRWVAPRMVDGELVGQATVLLPTGLDPGYHVLHARDGDGRTASCQLIVTPAWLGTAARLGQTRAWGLATQLYATGSRRSWGLGDLADLADLAAWSATEHGTDFILVNPLQAAAPILPIEPSPYLPVTRRFTSPLYLRIEDVGELAYANDQVRAAVSSARATVVPRVPATGELATADLAAAELTTGPPAVAALASDGLTVRAGATLPAGILPTHLLDRDAVWRAKRAALEALAKLPLNPGRAAAYRAFCEREGEDLRLWAVWCAIVDVHGEAQELWPAGLSAPGTAQTDAFAEQQSELVELHQRLQWWCDEQVRHAQAVALDSGMRVGIMHDLAVGVHPDGADPWRWQHVYAQGIKVGAPPDAYNQVGQDWSQPPWRPDRLADVGFEPWRQIVRTVLRHAGGIRVDHVIGLFRLWWIPDGAAPNDGTYVRCDHEALVGILALEASRSGAVVVGEDLGTVEPWVRTYLAERGILGTSILWFENTTDAQGNTMPAPPETWRDLCLAAVTTHDLPPTAGYLDGVHVRLRHELGLLTRTLDEELAADAAERSSVLDELRRRGLLEDSGVGDGAPQKLDQGEDIVVALHRYAALSPSRLLTVAVVDLVGDRQAQNQPGTHREYPNWCVPLTGPAGAPLLLEDLMSDRRAARLAAAVRAALAGVTSTP